MKITFLAVDSTGAHETGEPRHWQNTITVKYQLNYRDGSHRVILQAVPPAPLSDPRARAAKTVGWS
jgi:hypothetical protein